MALLYVVIQFWQMWHSARIENGIITRCVFKWNDFSIGSEMYLCDIDGFKLRPPIIFSNGLFTQLKKCISNER